MRSYFRLPKIERRFFREALWGVYQCKILLYFTSFERFSQKHRNTGKLKEASVEELKMIRRALQRTNKVTFWKNKCIVSTFAARKMLNKRNIYSEAFLGLRKEDVNDSLNAHAWLISNSVEIVPKELEYTELYSF